MKEASCERTPALFMLFKSSPTGGKDLRFGNGLNILKKTPSQKGFLPMKPVDLTQVFNKITFADHSNHTHTHCALNTSILRGRFGFYFTESSWIETSFSDCFFIHTKGIL